MSNVAGSQNTIIDELTAIENELDSILPQYESYFEELDGPDADPHGQTRDQVYGQAINIDQSLDGLNQDLTEIRQRIDGYQERTRGQPFKALALGTDKDTLEGMSENRQDIERILNTFYDTMKWVQGSALDLQF